MCIKFSRTKQAYLRLQVVLCFCLVGVKLKWLQAQDRYGSFISRINWYPNNFPCHWTPGLVLWFSGWSIHLLSVQLQGSLHPPGKTVTDADSDTGNTSITAVEVLTDASMFSGAHVHKLCCPELISFCMLPFVGLELTIHTSKATFMLNTIIYNHCKEHTGSIQINKEKWVSIPGPFTSRPWTTADTGHMHCGPAMRSEVTYWWSNSLTSVSSYMAHCHGKDCHVDRWKTCLLSSSDHWFWCIQTNAYLKQWH